MLSSEALDLDNMNYIKQSIFGRKSSNTHLSGLSGTIAGDLDQVPTEDLIRIVRLTTSIYSLRAKLKSVAVKRAAFTDTFFKLMYQKNPAYIPPSDINQSFFGVGIYAGIVESLDKFVTDSRTTIVETSAARILARRGVLFKINYIFKVDVPSGKFYPDVYTNQGLMTSAPKQTFTEDFTKTRIMDDMIRNAKILREIEKSSGVDLNLPKLQGLGVWPILLTLRGWLFAVANRGVIIGTSGKVLAGAWGLIVMAAGVQVFLRIPLLTFIADGLKTFTPAISAVLKEIWNVFTDGSEEAPPAPPGDIPPLSPEDRKRNPALADAYDAMRKALQDMEKRIKENEEESWFIKAVGADPFTILIATLSILFIGRPFAIAAAERAFVRKPKKGLPTTAAAAVGIKWRGPGGEGPYNTIQEARDAGWTYRKENPETDMVQVRE